MDVTLTQALQQLQQEREQIGDELLRALALTQRYASQLTIDTVLARYVFASRSYVADLIHTKFSKKDTSLTISGRLRASTAMRFEQSPRYRTAQNGARRLNGISVALLRGKSALWSGAFYFTGKQNNALMGYREKGAIGRGNFSVKYGPSVGASFGYQREVIAPQILQYLSKQLTL